MDDSKIFNKGIKSKYFQIFLIISLIFTIIGLHYFSPTIEYKTICKNYTEFEVNKTIFNQYESIQGIACSFIPIEKINVGYFFEDGNKSSDKEKINFKKQMMAKGILNQLYIGALIPIIFICLVPLLAFLKKKYLIITISIFFSMMFVYLLIINTSIYLKFVYGWW